VNVTLWMFVGGETPDMYEVPLYTTAPDSDNVGVPPGPSIVTDAVPVPTHVTVTTTCVVVD
jgi:hypothetical protein